MQVLIFNSDLGGCYTYRIKIPFEQLLKFGVEHTVYPFIPNTPGTPKVQNLIDMIQNYDLVIVQRCSDFNIVAHIDRACKFLGKPWIFETDDDYLHISPSNPAYYMMVPGKMREDYSNAVNEGDTNKAKELISEIERARLQGLELYKVLLSWPDLVTVSTEELARVIRPYNKNVVVLQNNVPKVFPYRDHVPAEAFADSRGNINAKHFENLSIYTIPNHSQVEDKETKQLKFYQRCRIGYSGTESHRNEDFQTIEYSWEKLIRKYHDLNWFVYIGDPYFFQLHEKIALEHGIVRRHVFIPPGPYELYMYQLRNLDIGIAPLHASLFNMSKSDIKAVELASWGIPSVLPDYCTYTRNFKHMENCLIYKTSGEFMECVEKLMTDPELRNRLGQAALKYVKENRLESQHAERRFNIYKELVHDSYPLKLFPPVKEIEVEPRV